MAVGENVSTNPFDEPSEDEDNLNRVKSASDTAETGPRRATITRHATLPFLKLVILLVCTVLVSILLIAGTATTALSYPSTKTATCDGNLVNIIWDGDYKLLGPLLLTSGCFMFCVDAVLWFVLIRESYYASKMMSKSATKPWNRNSIRPLPISLVGGPFFIATADPCMAQPPFLPTDLSRPNWVHPNAPLESQTPDGEFNKRSVVRPETATLSRGHQPPYNPEHLASMRGP